MSTENPVVLGRINTKKSTKIKRKAARRAKKIRIKGDFYDNSIV